MGEREVKSLEAQGQRDDVQEEGTKEEEKYNAYIVTGWNIKTTDEHKGKRIAVGIEGEMMDTCRENEGKKDGAKGQARKQQKTLSDLWKEVQKTNQKKRKKVSGLSLYKWRACASKCVWPCCLVWKEAY